MEANQNTTNICGKKEFPTEKENYLWNCLWISHQECWASLQKCQLQRIASVTERISIDITGNIAYSFMQKPKTISFLNRQLASFKSRYFNLLLGKCLVRISAQT
jgi:hypothetical protein